MMNIFEPVWNVTTPNLGAFDKDANVSIALSVQEILTAYVSKGISSYIVGPSFTAITKITFGGNITEFSTNTNAVVFPAITTNQTLMQIYRTPQSTFSILNGALPNGLTLASNGIISGTCSSNSSTSTVFNFTVRASNENTVRDHAFSLTVNSSLQQVTFDTSVLPPPTKGSQFTYYDYGNYDLGQPFACTFKISGTTESAITLTSSRIVSNSSTIFNQVPLGIAISANNLVGIIDTVNSAGEYYFDVNILNQSLPIKITIIDASSQYVQSAFDFSWITNSGSLGTCIPSQYYTYGLAANINNDVTPAYSIVGGLLPSGLSLSSDGAISGVPTAVMVDTVSTFTVRVSYLYYFIERTFSITTKAKLQSNDAITVSLDVKSSDCDQIYKNYYDLIPNSVLYLPNNTFYGFQQKTDIYLIGGFKSNSNLVNIVHHPDTMSSGFSGYFSPIELQLGNLRHAFAKLDSNEVLYEVLYFDIVDSAYNAGGFGFNTDYSIPMQMVSPISSTNVYAPSIRNMRLQLAKSIGIDAVDSTQINKVGTDSAELLPLWMSCDQVDNDKTSQLGFVPSLILCYVSPNKGLSLLEKLKDIAPDINEIKVDRLNVNTSVPSGIYL